MLHACSSNAYNYCHLLYTVKQNYYEQVKIEDMWSHMKYHSDRQLHPMQVHLDRLKVRENYKIYETNYRI